MEFYRPTFVIIKVGKIIFSLDEEKENILTELSVNKLKLTKRKS